MQSTTICSFLISSGSVNHYAFQLQREFARTQLWRHVLFGKMWDFQLLLSKGKLSSFKVLLHFVTERNTKTMKLNQGKLFPINLFKFWGRDFFFSLAAFFFPQTNILTYNLRLLVRDSHCIRKIHVIVKFLDN